MADVAHALQAIVKGGLTPANTGGLSNSDTYQVDNDGKMFLHLINGGGGTVVLTIETPGLVDGLAIADRTVSILAATNQMVGPFPRHIYNDANGKVNFSMDVITSVTVDALHLG